MKAEDYRFAIAQHYNAYRPPLHQVILDRCLEPETRFSKGLDVGSGTGQSALAMATYCETVTGIEPSDEMRAQAISQSGVNYLASDGKTLPVGNHQFDLVTFAGSWFYARSQAMVDEVARVAAPEAIVIIYDFELLFQKLPFGFELPEESSHYDHKADFSGFETKRIHSLGGFSIKKSATLNREEMAHLLLSSANYWKYFSARYEKKNPFPSLLKELEGFPTEHSIQAHLYASVYIHQ